MQNGWEQGWDICLLLQVIIVVWVDLSLAQGVLNFVQYKFSHLAPKERQTMYELSKMFLLCLNYWKLETPSQFRQRAQKEDAAAYKVDYTRSVYYVVNKCMFVDYIHIDAVTSAISCTVTRCQDAQRCYSICQNYIYCDLCYKINNLRFF